MTAIYYTVTPIQERFSKNAGEQAYPFFLKISDANNQLIQGEGMLILDHEGNRFYDFGGVAEKLNAEEKKGLEGLVRHEIEREKTIPHLCALKEWYCDKCNNIVTESTGKIEFIVDFTIDLRQQSHSFQLVHSESCSYDPFEVGGNVFEIALGDNAESELLQHRDEYDVIDGKVFKELLKRLQLPYYEEARRYLADPISSIKQIQLDRENLRKLVFSVNEA